MLRALLPLLMLPVLVQAQAPAHHWPLDESSGTVALDIQGGSHGQVQGNTFWEPLGGHFGGSLRFNGNTARALVGPCDLTTGPGDELTLSCWVKPDVVSQSERTLMVKTAGNSPSDHIWSLGIVNATAVVFRVKAAGSSVELQAPPASLFSGTWYHLAGVYDGAEMRIYINGALVAFAPQSGVIGFHPQAPACLGNLPNASVPYYGWMDDVRIYDRGLDQLEILDLVIGNVPTALQETPTMPGTLGLPGAPDHPWKELLVLDVQGRSIMRHPLTTGDVRPVLSQLPAGCYLVCLQDGAARWTTRYAVP